ncbi:DNA/RNA non-specific endonuclease [Lactiplantibacillus xiangfangensis]|uniref:Prophage Lp1 protein 65 n=1 Tax=Lactiplantibacillus xiangfangensis TaxID=942150 RepID=A0A0R2M5L2_9LACO|nr:DNA/RNA non-specific endonuclease [Lactiplantibacillus xiangfangensis]KRO09161.1 prophage Lp1 protein 65 [Lactiplantibacillus xiangfangensis]
MEIMMLLALISALIWIVWHTSLPSQRHRKFWLLASLLLVTVATLGGCGSPSSNAAEPEIKTETKTQWVTATNDKKLAALQSANSSSASSLKTVATNLNKEEKKVNKQKDKNQAGGATKATAATTVKAGNNPSNEKLADKTFAGQQTITVNHNAPAFSASDLSTSQGAWQKYTALDNLNRVRAANALLNQSLMPKAKREALHVNPTGWHNKRINSGWLYNRSHLIGYQLTGQNNNWKNLMTGTRTLNDPEMTTYENQVAAYLKASPKHYVRYEVKPIFKGNELLARGVQMRGQSVGDNSVSFNVYIFNVQPGVTLNYQTGTSRVGK